MLHKIGVFHFGRCGIADAAAPTASLLVALQESLLSNGQEFLAGSLVLLPEAFNLIGPYEARLIYEREPKVVDRLKEFAGQFNVVFVTGIIECNVSDSVLPFSSICLVTKIEASTLGRKTGEDDLANGRVGMGKLYRTSHECHTPLIYDGFCIAGLVCMDADSPEQRKSLRNRLGPNVIICVSASTAKLDTVKLADEWPDAHFLLANSYPNCDPKNSPSVIRIMGEDPVAFGKRENVIAVKQLKP